MEQRGYIKVAFFDSLPDGLILGHHLQAVHGGSVPSFDVTYSNGGQDASFGILCPSRVTISFTLRTEPTTLTGMIANDATITRSGYDPITAITNITLAGPTPSTIVIDADVDTSIAQGAPTWNGYSTQLYSTADSADPSQAMVYFDISDDVPPVPPLLPPKSI